MEEKEVAMGFIEGGTDELEHVMDIYSERLLRYATSILCDHYEAEDVVQECFISAYKNRKSFDGKNLSSWLYKITYNLSINKIKKRKILYFANIFSKDTYEIDSQETKLSQESLAALRKIKAKDRALLYGRIVEDMSYRELAFQMNMSEAALRKRYERAKDKLAEELKGKEGN